MNETIRMSLQLFESIISLFLIAAIGFVGHKKGLFNDRNRAMISTLMIYVTFPCLCFNAMVTKVKAETFSQNIAAILSGVFLMLIGCIFGYILVKFTSLSDSARKTFVLQMSTNNYIFMPLPIVLALWPDQEGVMFLMSLGCTLSFWIIGIYPLMHGQDIKEILRRMINAPVIAMLSGLIISLTGFSYIFQKPILKGILNSVNIVGSATIALSLIYVGAALASITAKVSRRVLSYYCFCRLILFPVLYLPVIYFSGLPKEAAFIPLLVSMMPASNTSAMIAAKFGGDEEFASSAILYSTPLSLLTIPLFFPIYSLLL
ncbi:MAG: AEC family transporter [Planctomycetota bacterium]|jgi:predicted permease